MTVEIDFGREGRVGWFLFTVTFLFFFFFLFQLGTWRTVCFNPINEEKGEDQVGPGTRVKNIMMSQAPPDKLGAAPRLAGPLSPPFPAIPNLQATQGSQKPQKAGKNASRLARRGKKSKSRFKGIKGPLSCCRLGVEAPRSMSSPTKHAWRTGGRSSSNSGGRAIPRERPSHFYLCNVDRPRDHSLNSSSILMDGCGEISDNAAPQRRD